MHFITQYGLFLLEVLTLVVAILVVFGGIVAIASKGKGKDKSKGKIILTSLNEKFDRMQETMQEKILSKKALKKQEKNKAKADKAEKKQDRKRVFVVDFNGNIKAEEVSALREIITAIVTVACRDDEVVLRIESPGGLVHAYGLAASQVQRIRDRHIPLTICVDKVAASGGYMMACVGDKILAAPFAIIGSIGVLAQVPNFNKALKKHNIEMEQISAGEYKRTLTMFGENTKKGREKFTEQLEDTHVLFKDFVKHNREQVNIEAVATGEYWYGKQALDLKLVDDLTTSDDYLLAAKDNADLYQVKFVTKKSWNQKLGHSASAVVGKLFMSVKQEAQEQNLV